MAWDVQYREAALKQLAKLPESIRTRIRKVVRDLAENPFPLGSLKMQGTQDYRRIRIGDYRVIYEVVDDRLVVIVVRIGHRKDIYR